MQRYQSYPSQAGARAWIAIARYVAIGAAVIVFVGGAPVSAQEDYERTRRAAEQGVVEAQLRLAAMYLRGQEVPQDEAEAFRWTRLAAEQGHYGGQFGVGEMYAQGWGVPQDEAEAVRWYRLAAEQGYAEAQYKVGDMYAGGRGVSQDDAEAVRWYRLAAEQGHADAQTNLDYMYANGRGVPDTIAPVSAQEDYEAIRCAAEQGDAEAQSDLGAMYAEGRGVPQDDAEAVRWFRLAAEQGHAGAQSILGVMYAEGRGVPQDDAEAVRWFRLAAEQGDADAQNVLDLMYAAGRGVPDTIQHGLQLSEGSPEPGFMFSALAGQLPNGSVTLTPAFEPGTTTYHADVSQPLLTIRARAAVSVDITATGVTADGRALPVVNQSRLNDVNGHGNFLSVTFSELAMGENTIQIAMGPAGPAYTIVLARSAPD